MKELLKTLVSKKIIIIPVVTVIGLASGYFLYNDNPIEETAEQIIGNQTGIEVDLTPQSPEKNSK